MLLLLQAMSGRPVGSGTKDLQRQQVCVPMCVTSCCELYGRDLKTFQITRGSSKCRYMLMMGTILRKHLSTCVQCILADTMQHNAQTFPAVLSMIPTIQSRFCSGISRLGSNARICPAENAIIFIWKSCQPYCIGVLQCNCKNH